jgi:hypothetical protein
VIRRSLGRYPNIYRAFDYYDGGDVGVRDEPKLVAGSYEANVDETARPLTMRDPAIAGYVSSQPAGGAAARGGSSAKRKLSLTGCQTFGQRSTTACRANAISSTMRCTSAIERRPMICAARARMLTAARSCGSCRLASWTGTTSACCSRCFARVTSTTRGACSV